MARMLSAQLILAVVSAALEPGAKSNGFVNLPIESVYNTRNSAWKRQTPSANLSEAFISHLIPLTIGTPPQTVNVVLDSGSFASWVNPNCNFAPDKALCGRTLPYNATLSTSAIVLPDADQTYSYSPDGSVQARVGFVNDTLQIGEADIPSMRLGVAKFSIGVSTGILGLGPDPNATVGFSKENGNGGIIAAMAEEAIISSRAYGLALGSSNVSYGPAGVVTFGGIDTNRFSGPLFKVPVTPYDQAPEKTVRFWARVQSFAFRLAGGNESVINFGAAYQDLLVDSGTTLTFLPPPVVAAVKAQIPGVSGSNGDYTVDCALLDHPPDGGLMFHFDKGAIFMSYDKIILDLRQLSPAQDPGCFLGIAEGTGGAGNQLPVLGRGFLEAAYAVFDLDNQNIHLAQSAHCGEANITAIRSGPDAVPSLLGNC